MRRFAVRNCYGPLQIWCKHFRRPALPHDCVALCYELDFSLETVLPHAQSRSSERFDVRKKLCGDQVQGAVISCQESKLFPKKSISFSSKWLHCLGKSLILDIHNVSSRKSRCRMGLGSKLLIPATLFKMNVFRSDFAEEVRSLCLSFFDPLVLLKPFVYSQCCFSYNPFLLNFCASYFILKPLLYVGYIFFALYPNSLKVSYCI
jgi:hypothetical protein